MAKIKKAARPETLIPTASMSDIAFLLLLFFMVSTVFVREKGLKVRLPKAEMIQKYPEITLLRFMLAGVELYRSMI